MSAVRRMQHWGTFARTWHVFDCKWQDPYLSAELLKRYLLGRHKPIFHPLNDCGDIVVAINSRDIALRGDDWTKRAYFHHTGYPGGASWTLAWELHYKDPTLVLKKAVYRSLGRTLQRKHTMERLLVYPNDKVPEEIMGNVTSQIRQLRHVPDRLDLMPSEDVDTYPKIMDWPEKHIVDKLK